MIQALSDALRPCWLLVVLGNPLPAQPFLYVANPFLFNKTKEGAIFLSDVHLSPRHVTKYGVRDYRYGNLENPLLIFTCAEPDKLEDFAAVFFQYEEDARTRTDLEPFRRGDLPYLKGN